ncbi:hypothetical protein [Mitsuaria sp. GD03876]|uniref:hypothetical protein n=1 Tax=Mitsuaria sp. GD03876 TaxID=2975399 RepID=UPI002449A374|nr:hypothetical protein [Mitsuaria sp. GD03876]MDH0864424.1 hypothetical protein [Mitsuaria sp. GD03876]
MRSIALLLLSFSAPFTAQAANEPTSTAAVSIKASACQETDRMMDWREITCALPADAKLDRFSFRAMFTGGHDDTSASIVPELDGQPFACGPGSKLSLFGEDGNVSVHCQFTRASVPATGARLKVLIKWSHAEFADYDFAAE